jgi:hypothetical protein
MARFPQSLLATRTWKLSLTTKLNFIHVSAMCYAFQNLKILFVQTHALVYIRGLVSRCQSKHIKIMTCVSVSVPPWRKSSLLHKLLCRFLSLLSTACSVPWEPTYLVWHVYAQPLPCSVKPVRSMQTCYRCVLFMMYLAGVNVCVYCLQAIESAFVNNDRRWNINRRSSNSNVTLHMFYVLIL